MAKNDLSQYIKSSKIVPAPVKPPETIEVPDYPTAKCPHGDPNHRSYRDGTGSTNCVAIQEVEPIVPSEPDETNDKKLLP